MSTDIFGDSRAYTHNGDQTALEALGLRTWNFSRDWTPLGTVTVQEAQPDGEYGPRPAATVEVEVCAMPAQFWRFTITRPRDDIEDLPDGTWRAVYEPVEQFVVETGSGGFGAYWPTAEKIAQHMLSVRATS